MRSAELQIIHLRNFKKALLGILEPSEDSKLVSKDFNRRIQLTANQQRIRFHQEHKFEFCRKCNTDLEEQSVTTCGSLTYTPYFCRNCDCIRKKLFTTPKKRPDGFKRKSKKIDKKQNQKQKL